MIKIDEWCKGCKDYSKACDIWSEKMKCGLREMRGVCKMSIYTKILKIQTNLKAPKSQYNSYGGYAYRNCEDILEALKPHLLQSNLVLTISDDIAVMGDRFYIKASVTLYDIDSGESLTTHALARETQERKGMDTSQITGATSTYARKYALNGLFCIDDSKDADTPTDTGGTQAAAPIIPLNPKTAAGGEEEPAYKHQPNEKPTDEKTKKTDRKLNITQQRKLYATGYTYGFTEADIKKAMAKLYKKSSAKDLLYSEYKTLLERMETKYNAKKAAEQYERERKTEQMRQNIENELMEKALKADASHGEQRKTI